MPCYEDLVVTAQAHYEGDLVRSAENVIRVTAETAAPLGQDARPYKRHHPDTSSWKATTRASKQYLRHV